MPAVRRSRHTAAGTGAKLRWQLDAGDRTPKTSAATPRTRRRSSRASRATAPWRRRRAAGSASQSSAITSVPMSATPCATVISASSVQHHERASSLPSTKIRKPDRRAAGPRRVGGGRSSQRSVAPRTRRAADDRSHRDSDGTGSAMATVAHVTGGDVLLVHGTTATTNASTGALRRGGRGDRGDRLASSSPRAHRADALVGWNRPPAHALHQRAARRRGASGRRLHLARDAAH